MKKVLLLCLLMSALVAAPVPVLAFTDGFGSTATFNVSSGDLIVTLTDNRPATSGGEELTALFFTLPSTPTLTPVSALIGGSTVIGGPYPAGGNVGGEWAYLTGLSGLPGGATSGISSTGLGIFGAPNFNGPNLAGPAAVDGGQFGLTAGTMVLPGNNSPLVKNSVVFTLSGAGSLDLSKITNVTLFYGTELGTTSVPEPTTLLLLGFGLFGIAGIKKRFAL